MTVDHEPRFQLPSWTAGSDPWPGRVGWSDILGLIAVGAIRGQQGLIAARPAAGVPLRLYLATDTKRLYWDDGIAWTEISPIGGGPTAAPVTVGGPAIPGVSRIGARADHGHALPAPAVDPASISYGGAAARGVSATPACADHTHALDLTNMPRQMPTLIGSEPMASNTGGYGVGGQAFQIAANLSYCPTYSPPGAQYYVEAEAFVPIYVDDGRAPCGGLLTVSIEFAPRRSFRWHSGGIGGTAFTVGGKATLGPFNPGQACSVHVELSVDPTSDAVRWLVGNLTVTAYGP